MGKEFAIGTRFNDIITKEEIAKWEGENVILNGATGSGKTYFVLNNLYDYAREHNKKILYLCNRTELYREVCDIKSNDIAAMLYQTLESKIRKGNIPNKYYDYIVCDEIHYLLCDVVFNVYVDLTYDWVVNKNNNLTKIFMSGTGTSIFGMLKKLNIVKEEFEYTILYDYSYANIVLYKGKKKVFDIINKLIENTNDKIIYFTNKIEDGINVYEQFKKYSTFRCSKNTKDKKAQEINDIDCIKRYNNITTFDNRLLVTTKCLDNGITLKDRNIKHIICDIFDLDSLQQALGRKRIIDKDDTCTFYIKNNTSWDIGRYKGGLETKFRNLKMFIEDNKSFNKMYESDRSFHDEYIYIENGKRSANELAYCKYILDSSTIEHINKVGYKEVLLSRFGDTLGGIKDLDKIETYEIKCDLELYLRNNIGKRYYKDKKQELIDMIGLRDSRGREQKSVKCLSSYLQDNFELYIVSNKDQRKILENGNINPNKGLNYWEIREGILY